jgi:hypothetical protein
LRRERREGETMEGGGGGRRGTRRKSMILCVCESSSKDLAEVRWIRNRRRRGGGGRGGRGSEAPRVTIRLTIPNRDRGGGRGRGVTKSSRGGGDEGGEEMRRARG